MDTAESERFLEGLVPSPARPRTWHHDWAPARAVVWDNRWLLHQATPWDMTQRRIMWHSRIAGDPKRGGLTDGATPQPRNMR
jgi:alpha-ketoglutarate-dependent taurine dioxygenase